MSQTARAIFGSALICALGLPAGAEDGAKSVDEILACLQRTRPVTRTVRTVELVRRDRVGAEQTLRAKVYGGLSREGFRTLLIQMVAPADLKGASVLITEREGANHMFLSPAGLPEVRQIRGAPGKSSLFGTDFSYEDLERLYGLERPQEAVALEGTLTDDDGRARWLLRTTPSSESDAGYRRIVSHVDQKTCVLLRAEMYEAGEAPRKVLTAAVDSLKQEGSVWVAHEMLMRDLRDGTETRLTIDQIELDVDHRDVPFTPEELGARERDQG